MCRIYKCAPLPFIGQKRHFVREFAGVLKQMEGRIDTVVDLFGGSGLLSHTAKRVLPRCRVVYNDFDNYERRLAAVEDTNAVLRAIKELLNGVEPKKRLTDRQRADVLATVAEAQERLGWVDIPTIARSLLFSGKWANSLEELGRHTMYNQVKAADYDCDGYLDGLEIVRVDYRELFGQERGNSRALFVIDPPYLSTECGMYANHWRLTDYLDVLRLLKDTKYVYFTSDKSQIVELCRFLAAEYGDAAPMRGATVRMRTNTVNYQSRYNDMMIIKT